MSQPKQLFQLQQTDSQLDKTKLRLSEIEIALNDNSVLKRAINAADLAEKLQKKAQLALKRAEQEVESQQIKISNNERALYGGAIKNPKELEDLQMESGALKRHLATLEDRLLEAMVAFEEADENLKSTQTNLEDTRVQTAAENEDLIEEREQLREKVDQLQIQKEKLCGPIDEDSLRLYQKLRKTKAGVAVTEVTENSCAACGATLTAAQAQAARSPSKLTTCETCRRILYSK